MSSLAKFTEKLGGSTLGGEQLRSVRYSIHQKPKRPVGSLSLNTVAFIEPETHEKMHGTKLKPNDVC